MFRIIGVFALIIVIGGYFFLNLRNKVFASNVEIKDRDTANLYIPTGSTYEEVTGLLEVSGHLKDLDDFKWVAEIKDYPGNIEPGRYVLHDGMNNNELVNMLRGGMQTPVKVTFNNIRTKEELAGKVAGSIEADSTELLNALNDTTLLENFGFTPATVFAMTLPNTYEMWWNTDAESFIKRMHEEYEDFWNEERRNAADSVGLTPKEVAVLASIVDEETIKEDEKRTVAGVYINRLDQGIKLQADPTIKYVMGDFSINRVLTQDLATISPYNTYLNEGLPPGPIRVPSSGGIEAVLDHENHDYLYMCAKDDFSGYHNFAETLRQHNINARKYRRALQERRIWR
ncbi:MAG: endolytic transglycosylase MltG [Marinilabilia sp.]